MALQLRFVSHSETGPVRKNNQDSGFASPHLLVVADGMGGAAAGDLASAVAIDTIRTLDSADGVVLEGNAMLDAMAGVLTRANDRISDLIQADHNLEGMGTTVTAALFDGTQFGLAHIGDSRAYLLRDGRLERLTHDHSWVQSLVDDGKISDEEAAVHPHRSLLLKVLNGQPANDPDLTTVRVEPGDRLLFCSDGVCGLVDDAGIESALQVSDLAEALRMLVSEALAEGGIDNITAIVADVVEADGGGTTATLGAAAERKIPTVPPPAAASGEEPDDTLIRDEPMVAAAAEPEDEARYNPQAPHRSRLVRPLVGLLALALVLAAAIGAGYAWTRTQYFVGASAGQVAIFQGLPEGLPGVALSSVYEVQPQLPVAALPPYYQEQVTAGIEVAGLDAARQTVAQLREAARRCAGPTPSPTPTTTPTTKPTTTPTTKPTTTPTTKPTTAPPTGASGGATLPTGSATATLSAVPTAPASPAVTPGGGC